MHFKLEQEYKILNPYFLDYNALIKIYESKTINLRAIVVMHLDKEL